MEEAAENIECDVCGYKKFVVEAGFYYCLECGTQSQKHGQEQVHEFQAGMETAQKLKIKTSKTEARKITSWEQFNYILLGLAERLIDLGAGEKFKLTLLQLWTSYLRRQEVAFFDREKPEKPRLTLPYRQSDVELLYNRDRKRKRSRSRSSCSTSQGLPSSESAPSQQRGRCKSQRSMTRASGQTLLNQQHESFMAAQQSDVNKSLEDMSVRTLNASRVSSCGSESSTPQRRQKISFSRLARTRMKRDLKMSTKHIDKHERDTEGTMECHQFRRDKPLPAAIRSGPYNISRTTLTCLLVLGLNLSQSDVQLADLLRFYREDHIPQTNLLQYLPEELDPKCYHETLANLQTGARAVTHKFMRQSIRHLIKLLSVQPCTPDLVKLCKRYLDELGLPAELLVYIKRLMAVFPPEMKYEPKQTLPNYEGRAMAFIIFLLKLLLGLNGTTELKISKSAAKLNKKIEALAPQLKKLFVFEEWLRYIEMRKVILSQTCHPINRMLAIDQGTEPNPALFLDFQLRRRQEADTFLSSSISFRKSKVFKIKESVNNMIDNKRRAQKETTKPVRSIEFEASLTPFRSYLEVFLLAYKDKTDITVPSYMYVNHANRRLDPFVDATELKQLLVDYNITLSTRKVKTSLDAYQFVKCEPLIYSSPDVVSFVDVDDCRDEDWKPSQNRDPPSHDSDHEEKLNEILIRNIIEHETTETMLTTEDEPPIATEPEGGPNDCTEQPSFCSESLFSQETTETPLPPNQTFQRPENVHPRSTLLVPNYDYWVRHYDKLPSEAWFDEHIAVGLPNSFRVLLEECARVVESRPKAVYEELMAIESYFFYAIEPVERIFMPETGRRRTGIHCGKGSKLKLVMKNY